jgi:hypothetical protein
MRNDGALAALEFLFTTPNPLLKQEGVGGGWGW